MMFGKQLKQKLRNGRVIVKEKVKLYETPYGFYSLKRWDTDKGFYIEYTPLMDYEEPKIYSKGSSLNECIENLNDECPYDNKLLFKDMTNFIIDSFNLTDDEKDYMISFGEWCDF